MFKQMFLFLFLFEGNVGLSQPFIHNKVIVNLHLEKFNKYYNLYHIGISFKNENENKIIRYDYRQFNEEKSLNTNQLLIIDKVYKLLLSKFGVGAFGIYSVNGFNNEGIPVNNFSKSRCIPS